MKELTIEEKAARYDKAIEIAKNNYDTIVGMDENCTFARSGIINTFHHMFPELKESEDDGIREWLIGYFNQYIIDGMPQFFGNGLNVKDVIAWLEKQGDIDRRIQEEIEKQTKQQWKAEKQVEPKFKVGDYLVTDYCKGKVIALTDDAYLLDTEQGIPFSCEHNAHLWTIQDAKDGDVLATDTWLYVFKSTNNKALIQFHCSFPINGKPHKWCVLPDDDYLDIYIDANIHPATKEQRDLLFQKMKEVGYEWDAEKKELTKIVTPIFKIGDRVRYKEHSCDGVITEITDTDYVCGDSKLPISTQDKLELVEQKSAWSEDDVMNSVTKDKESAIKFLKSAGIMNENGELAKEYVADNIEQNPAWGEEDEEMFDAIIADIQFTQKAHTNEVNQVVYEREIDWLKSIKDRVQPQQEWGEEDEKMLKWLCRIVHSQRLGKVITLKEESELGEWMDKWLNHNPQNTWKPSDEQIATFWDAICNLNHDGYKWIDDLKSLFQDLNKLRGE